MESKKIKILRLEEDRILFKVLGYVFAFAICLICFSFTTFNKQLKAPVPLAEPREYEIGEISPEKEKKKPEPEKPKPVDKDQIKITDNNTPSEEWSGKEPTADENNKAIPLQGYTEPDPVIDSVPVDIPFDEEVSFKGGEEAFRNFIDENIVFPESQIDLGNDAYLWVSFVVDANGRVSSILVEGTDIEEFRDEVIRVIRLTNGHWNPARFLNRNYRSIVKLPIEFELK